MRVTLTDIAATNIYHSYSVRVPSTQNTAIIRDKGQSVTSSTQLNPSKNGYYQIKLGTPTYQGMQRLMGGLRYNAIFCEYIVFDRSLTDAENLLMEQYLQTKWAV